MSPQIFWDRNSLSNYDPEVVHVTFTLLPPENGKFNVQLVKYPLPFPNTEIKSVPKLTYKSLKKKSLNSKDIFNKNSYYLLNIWASWCTPCRNEHPFLISLNKNENIKIIGLNYKDNKNNAEKFLNELGNPYSTILLDTPKTFTSHSPLPLNREKTSFSLTLITLIK